MDIPPQPICWCSSWSSGLWPMAIFFSLILARSFLSTGALGGTAFCREAGARAIFEKKLQEDDAWKLYKRAYKKYYARVMKGNMSREDFNTWVEFAAGRRDTTLLLLEGTTSAEEAEEKAGLIERLRGELNKV